MDKQLLDNYFNNRVNLISKYPQLVGRHAFFEQHRTKLEEGLDMLKKKNLTQSDKYILKSLGKQFVEIRNKEEDSHRTRFKTLCGDIVHDSEYLLYSLALDTFQTYGNSES